MNIYIKSITIYLKYMYVHIFLTSFTILVGVQIKLSVGSISQLVHNFLILLKFQISTNLVKQLFAFRCFAK